MIEVNKDPEWGFHLNETIYSLICPPCPKRANSWEQQNWHKLGVVVWDARVHRVTHLHGSQAIHILEQAQQSEAWKKEGMLVREVAHHISISSHKKSKSQIADQPEPKASQENGWCLTNSIQLVPDEVQRFISFLEQHETNLEKVVQVEAAERRKILGQVYSLILSWRDKREKGSASINAKASQEAKIGSSGAITIPHGKYLIIAQVAEICAVKETTISAWLEKGLLKGLDLPGLGQIVEEKELNKYLKEKRNRS